MICFILAILVYVLRIFLKGEATIHTGLTQAEIMAESERKRLAVLTRRHHVATQSSKVEMQKVKIREKQKNFQDILDSDDSASMSREARNDIDGDEEYSADDIEGNGLTAFIYGGSSSKDVIH